MILPPPTPPLFPYTTLFRSQVALASKSSGPSNCLYFMRVSVRIHSWNGRSSSSRSEEHTSELQSQSNLVCRLLLEKKNAQKTKSRLEGVLHVADGCHSDRRL